VPAGHVAADDAAMRQIEKSVGTGFTALSAWDMQIYPHEQVLADVQNLQAAVADLQLTTPNTDDALTHLGNVALTGYGLMLSHPVYVADLARRRPDYYRADWGAQGHLIDYLDVMPEYGAISGGTWGPGTIASLQTMAASDVTDLNSRLAAMTAVLRAITPQVAALD
jgi:outer membrane murein-binding lipoprotein Lpp